MKRLTDIRQFSPKAELKGNEKICRQFNKAMIDVPQHPEVRFYTTGFAGKDINDLKPMLDQLDSLLIDVQFSPTNELISWRQIYLKTLLREKYRHVAQLGNRPGHAPISRIHYLELGLKVLLSYESNAVLMCE